MCEIPEDFRWSHSALAAYRHCPMMFKLCYIDKVERQGNAFSDFGTFCHKLLEDYAKDKLPLIALAEEYEDGFDASVRHTFPPFPAGMGQKYFEAGKRYFENFDGFGEEWEILASEQWFELNIDGNHLAGIVDLVLRDRETGEIMVVDHKSKSASSMKKELLLFRMQLYIYAMWVKEQWGVWPSILRFNMFKEGYNIDEPFDPSMVDTTRQWILDTIQCIREEKEWKVCSSSYFCRWVCSCIDHCPAKEAVLYGGKKNDV